MKLRGKRKRGFLLPLALVFLFVLLFLLLGLYSLQQRAVQDSLNESTRLAHLIGTEELYSNLEIALKNDTSSGAVTIGQTNTYRVPNSTTTLTAKWGEKESLNRPMPFQWATYDSLLSGKKAQPDFSFTETDDEGNLKTPSIPVGHTRYEIASTKPSKGVAVTSYSHLFPFGLYAPEGEVTATAVHGFINPVRYSNKDEAPILTESGRPVDIYAKSNVHVAEFYSKGSAWSELGEVILPSEDSQGGIPLSGHAAVPKQWESHFETLTNLSKTLSAGTLDKTVFLDDQIFSFTKLREIFGGDTKQLLSIFSVGQACKVPFFPIPAIQDDAPLLVVFYVLHPYPVDFSGVARNGEDSKKLKEIGQELAAKQKELEDKERELANEESQKKPDKDKVSKLRGQISDLKDKIASLKKDAKDIADKMNKKSRDIGTQLSGGKIPETAAEDGKQVTEGWAYLFVFAKLGEFVVDLLSGQDPFAAFFEECRVVHFGDQGPDWKWSDDQIDMKANLTVPRGRTLKIVKSEVQVRGDVYMQAGATLFVEGDLTIERPDDWTDFKGVEASEYGGYPSGRLIIEEGCNLIVSGKLSITGGSYDNGSIMVTSDYGPSKGITSLIHAGGDIEARYGMMPAVTMGDLIDQLAEDNPALKGFNDDFFRPLTEQMFTLLGRLPYAGPWQWRPSWFAKYATTFEFIPLLEEVGLGGPWPIPLPFENCLRKAFNYLSVVYAVELNAFTGENFYTHSPFWPMGRGVTPVLLKVNPELVKDELDGIQWGKITLSSLENEALNFLEQELPEFAVNVVENVITEIIKQAVLSVIPFKPPTCGKGAEKEEKEIEDAIKRFLKDALKEFGGLVKLSFKKILLTMKNEVYANIDSDQEEYSIYRQLPGVVVASGGNIRMSEKTPARLASGLFIADQNVTIGCEKTVGQVVSINGDISVDNFFHYPYFDRSSLYKAKTYKDIFESIPVLGDPEGSVAGDVGGTYPTRLAEGWR